MPKLDTLLEVFDEEWNQWGKSTWHLGTGAKHIGSIDDDPIFAQYVVDKYCSVVGDEPSLSDISDDEYYWSAVGISYGFEKGRFQEGPVSFL